MADVEDFIRKSIGRDLHHAHAEVASKEAVEMVKAAEEGRRGKGSRGMIPAMQRMWIRRWVQYVAARLAD